jgi:hypothetical protein
MTKTNSALQWLGEQYKQHPIISALLQLEPKGFGSFLDVMVHHAIDEMLAERMRVFYDELAEGTECLTEELIQNHDFLHQYIATTRAVVRTRHKGKLKLFARLLLHAASAEYLLSDARFEEYLAILDDLSIRELHVLLILQSFENNYPHKNVEVEGKESALENDLQRAMRFWGKFETTVATECGIPPDQLSGFLARLSRTGLYEPFIGGYWNYTGGKGKLTPLYMEFAKWVHLEEFSSTGGEIEAP